MKDMQQLREMLCKELKQYEARSKLNLADLDAVHKLTDTIKNIDKIEMLEEGGMDEYAEARYSRRGGEYAYDDGNSYARRGRHYVRGHYSRDGGYAMNDGYARDGYSRDGGMERVMDMMRDMMEDASPEERKTIERMMDAARK